MIISETSFKQRMNLESLEISVLEKGNVKKKKYKQIWFESIHKSQKRKEMRLARRLADGRNTLKRICKRCAIALFDIDSFVNVMNLDSFEIVNMRLGDSRGETHTVERRS